MKRLRLLTYGLWALTVGVSLRACHVLATSRAPASSEVNVELSGPASSLRPVASEVDTLIEAVIGHSLFSPSRLSGSRRITDSEIEIGEDGEVESPEPAPSPLTLDGIVGISGNWHAVIRGIPHAGVARLVSRGDSIGEVRVQDIGDGWITLQRADSLIRLALRASTPEVE